VVGFIFVFVPQSDWTFGWTYVGLLASRDGISKMILLIWNPDLLQRRQRIGSGTKAWDTTWFGVFLINEFAVSFVAVQDFDMRFGDLDSSEIAWLTGLVAHAAGWAIFTLSSVANPFLEAPCVSKQITGII
jgi:hypothetical protein